MIVKDFTPMNSHYTKKELDYCSSLILDAAMKFSTSGTNAWAMLHAQKIFLEINKQKGIQMFGKDVMTDFMEKVQAQFNALYEKEVEETPQNQKDFEEAVKTLNHCSDPAKNTILRMKIVREYCMDWAVTDKGIKRGKELYERIKRKETLTRDEKVEAVVLMDDYALKELDNPDTIMEITKTAVQIGFEEKFELGYLTEKTQVDFVKMGYHEPNKRKVEFADIHMVKLLGKSSVKPLAPHVIFGDVEALKD